MKFTLLKKLDGEWYCHGCYSDNNVETLCMAYREVTAYADDVKIEVEREEDNE